MLNKQLRLDVAQLTDVGKRREHNEDNMAYVIPKDPQVMAHKGALFIVADGMGGHAAGEVASEIAVDTITTMYYQDDQDDVPAALLAAIKRANALIHQRAAENMLRSGMGTTCVAGVLRGDVAYIANVGDSRAYILRKGRFKQITQDHSWVAEQVRAGLLTEDQARTHAQRNVITRSLGTQPEVEVDVFVEPLEDGDHMLLCTDGLSGYVSDEDIRAIIERYPPGESVYHLIERANDNGGPDNITAIVISVMEVGVEPPGVRHPVVAGRIMSSDTSEDTAILSMLPSSPTASPAAGDNRIPVGYGRYPSGPLAPVGSMSITQAAPAERRQRVKTLYAVLALFVIVLLALGGGGIYLYLSQAGGNGAVAGQINTAQKLINRAQGETVNSPATALRDLASAQNQLVALEKNTALTAQQHTKVLSILNGSFIQSVKNAITSYNQQSNLISLACLSNVSSSAVSVGTTGTQPGVIAIANVHGKPALYFLGTNHQLYISNPTNTTNTSLVPAKPKLPAGSSILNITGYNVTQLALLISQQGKNAVPTFSLDIFDASKNAMVSSVNLAVQDGQLPRLMTTWQKNIYIVLSAPNATQITIADYAPGKNNQLQSTSNNVSVSFTLTSIAAFPNNQLVLIEQDGTVQSLQFGSNQGATSVFVDQPVPQPLLVSASSYTWRTPVPIVAAGGQKTLAVPNAATANAVPNMLVASMIGGIPHLFIMDANLHRILDLTPAPNAVTPAASPTSTATTGAVGGGTGSSSAVSTLHVHQQYTSPALFTQMKSMAVDPQSNNLSVLAQSATSSLNLVSFSASARPQANCS